ncbi:unnamed protein product [Closterium sp. NIES-53]
MAGPLSHKPPTPLQLISIHLIPCRDYIVSSASPLPCHSLTRVPPPCRFPRQTPPWAAPRRSPMEDDAERPQGARASSGRGLRRASTERAATMDALPSVVPLDADNAAEQRSPGDSQSPWPAADFLRGPLNGNAAAEPAIRQQGPTGVPRCLSFDGYQPRTAESKWAGSAWGRAYLGERGSPRMPRGHCAVRGSLSAGAEGASARVGSLQRVESGKVAPTIVQI